MDSTKVWLLYAIARLNALGIAWIKVQRDGGLIADADKARTIQCDDVHALRLTWFGLLETKEKRSGEYRIISAGMEFLEGKLPVPKTIWCKDGLVVKQTIETVFISEVKNVVLDKSYWDSYAARQIPA